MYRELCARLFYTALYFSIFVLDSNAALVGLNSCYGKFKGTQLETFLGNNSITCNPSTYAGIVVIDLIQVFTFYFLYECWSMTDNLYSDKGHSNHGAKPFVRIKQEEEEKRRYQQQSDSVQNPLQDMQGGTGQNEFGPHDSLHAQFEGMNDSFDMPPAPPPPTPKEKDSFCFLL